MPLLIIVTKQCSGRVRFLNRNYIFALEKFANCLLITVAWKDISHCFYQNKFPTGWEPLP